MPITHSPNHRADDHCPVPYNEPLSPFPHTFRVGMLIIPLRTHSLIPPTYRLDIGTDGRVKMGGGAAILGEVGSRTGEGRIQGEEGIMMLPEELVM